MVQPQGGGAVSGRRDKRGLPRVNVVIPVDFGREGESLAWRGQTYNLTFTGMGVESEAECEAGWRIHCRFVGAVGERLGEVSGRIIYTVPHGTLRRYGVHFDRLTPEAESTLAEYLWGVRRLLHP